MPGNLLEKSDPSGVSTKSRNFISNCKTGHFMKIEFHTQEWNG
ncbi:hypothetical protein [Salegentibacter maritimus]|nr:hypothetical protein [Salegentibacter maritimus]